MGLSFPPKNRFQGRRKIDVVLEGKKMKIPKLEYTTPFFITLKSRKKEHEHAPRK